MSPVTRLMVQRLLCHRENRKWRWHIKSNLYVPFTFVCFFFFLFLCCCCCCCCCCCFVCLCGCCHSDDCFPSFQPILYPHPFPNKTKREREKQEQTNKQKRAIIVTNAYPSTIKWFLPVEMFCTWKSKCLYTLPFSMLPCFVQCYPAMSNVTLPCYNWLCPCWFRTGKVSSP